jgi:hypothetical protein
VAGGSAPEVSRPSEPDAQAPAPAPAPTTKSERSRADAAAADVIGVAATEVGLRVLASMGKLQCAPAQFTLPHEGVSCGGALFLLPALLVCGLLRHAPRFFQLPKGYYGLESIFLLLAWLALCRVKNLEGLRYTSPGEWGKLLGLDRSPETKTLRAKIQLLAACEAAAWAVQLCEDWMTASPEAAGILYVDGHCRVYHGRQTELPRHYIARQRLCLRATTDYWVHGLDGMPFFKVNQPVDPGLIRTLEEEIIPELERTVPGQPTDEELKANPLRQRFRVIFDREGYSPGLFKRLNARRIAAQTYLKNPGAPWPESEFTERSVTVGAAGAATTMRLAERGSRIGSGADALWVREIRKLNPSGHQVAIVGTDWLADAGQIAAPQFGRWCQENYFKYAREHFELDGLIDYQLEPLNGSTRVVNPAWRAHDGAVRKAAGELGKQKIALADLNLAGEAKPARAEAYMERGASLRAALEAKQGELAAAKAARKAERKHITVDELPEEARFLKLATRAKHFLDTIKMIAYRAETAVASEVRQSLNEHHQDEARALVRDICQTEADLHPDLAAGTLTVTLHSLSTPKANAAVRALCQTLNETETVYPGTELRMVFKSVSE